MSAEPVRVLIVCDSASEAFGGEAILPLHYFHGLRKRGHSVWLLTHARVRSELNTLYPGDDTIYYVDDSSIERTMSSASRYLPSRLANFTTEFVSRLFTQLRQRSLARRLIAKYRIDVVHQPTPVSPREPSAMHGFGIPVVVGPMNGGMEVPPAFRTRQGLAERICLHIGRAASAYLNRVMPGKQTAALLLVANERTRLALAKATSNRRVRELVENGVDLSRWNASIVPASTRLTSETVFVFLGRLVQWKRVDLLIEAFAAMKSNRVALLHIVGDGDQRSLLEQQALRLGVSGSVRFHGWLQQARAVDVVRAGDCLVLPSLYECGGAVVLEAMSLAKPVIATDWGGPADYLDATCGVLIPPTGEAAMVSGLHRAMVQICSSPQWAAELGAAGRARVLERFNWDRKIDRIIELYALAQRNHRQE